MAVIMDINVDINDRKSFRSSFFVPCADTFIGEAGKCQCRTVKFMIPGGGYDDSLRDIAITKGKRMAVCLFPGTYN